MTWTGRKVRDKVREKDRILREEEKPAIIIRQSKVKTEEGMWMWAREEKNGFLTKSRGYSESVESLESEEKEENRKIRKTRRVEKEGIKALFCNVAETKNM